MSKCRVLDRLSWEWSGMPRYPPPIPPPAATDDDDEASIRSPMRVYFLNPAALTPTIDSEQSLGVDSDQRFWGKTPKTQPPSTATPEVYLGMEAYDSEQSLGVDSDQRFWGKTTKTQPPSTATPEIYLGMEAYDSEQSLGVDSDQRFWGKTPKTQPPSTATPETVSKALGSTAINVFGGKPPKHSHRAPPLPRYTSGWRHMVPVGDTTKNFLIKPWERGALGPQDDGVLATGYFATTEHPY
ncbi:hypothetical protein C8R44DRAFT_755382 [Mycena epipterygia]|nr:hypothetical protein C8R44DRAFT_755382 [Mycena epipterygia]